MPQTASQAIMVVFIGYILSAIIVITLFTLCVIALRAKIKFYKNMNRFIDENKDRVSRIFADSAEKKG